MDEDSDNNFESLLKNSKLRKQQIYTETSERADGMKSDKSRQRLMNVVKPALEPVYLLSLDNNRPQSNQKFETQGVSDTQLINIVVNAEILATPKGATQEFENSFCENHIEVKKNSPKVSQASKNDSKLAVNKAQESINTLEGVPSTSKTYNYRQIEDTYFSEKSNIDINNVESNAENTINLSPIAGQNKCVQIQNTSPLTYTLDAFENFESLAFSVIEQNPNVDLAKAIINSQIIDRELFITDAKPTISEGPISPILTTAKNNADFNKIDQKPFKDPDKVYKETKRKKSFEEDIFCSDEENIEEENFRELPETCALENCLSNPTVLDKTMYVGFQTASNKSIQINTDSFCKAQNILDEIDCDYNPTLVELVEICDKTSKNQSNAMRDEVHKPVSQQLSNNDKLCTKTTASTSSEVNLSRELKPCSNKLDHNKAESAIKVTNKPAKSGEDIDLIGFKTASSKKINLSDKALARCRQVFQDINLDEILDPKEISNTSSSINAALQNNGTNETKAQYNDEFLEVSEQIALNDQTILQEFENELLATAVTDFEKGQQEETIENPIENKKDKKGFNQNIHVNEHNKLSESKSNELHINHKNIDFNKEIFVGFKTANNKKIKISENALAKTKNIFEEFNLFNEVDKKKKKDEGINRETKPLYQNMFKEPLILNEKETCGFVTASKKPIVISSEALIKSKKVFEDIVNDIKNDIELPEKNNSNKCVKNSIQSNNYIKETYQTKSSTVDNNESHKSNNEHEFKIPHNQTKKSVNICTKSELFKDMLDFSGSYGAKEDCSIESSHKSNENKNMNQVFKGFQTASNKQVKVSEKSLAASKKLFEDLQINENDNINVESYILKEKQTKFTNKDSTPQNEFNNVQNENEIFNNFKGKIAFEGQNFNKHQGFNGFRSASNKVIKISEQALAKSKKMFLDIDEQIINSAEPSTNLLNTELNEPVKKINKFETNSENNCNEEYRDILPNSKRIKISNQLLDAKISQDSNQENKQSPFKSQSTEKFTPTINKASTNFEILFKTANNNNIKISEDALLESKRVLTDLNQNDQVIETNFSQSTDKKNEGSTENILNTQLLNNFEDTLYTEDFCKDVPKTTKRCGSPILSCPRAKKLKRFEVPYNKWEIPKIKSKENKAIEVNSSIKFTFDKNYKRNNKLSMKNLKDIDCNKSVEIDPYILSFNFENTLEFKFSNKRNEVSDEILSTDDLKKYFLSLVNKNIIPDGWIDNHLKLIIFKLISYEKEFKYTMKSICSVKNVLEQLKYRYDRELYNVERPAFRKLLEKDDVSTKTMVLRVIAIFVDGVIAESIPDTSNIELLLTDGWYCIKSSLDQMLTRLVKDHKIRVGTKLVTNGAELLNCEQGIAPWEDTSAVRLKLFGNCTRRARFDAKLGYHKGAAILSRLSKVQLEGGKVSKLRALVTRVYPTLYVEKFEDGSTVTRSERLEHLYQMKYESDRQVLLEKIYEEVQKEFIDEDSQDSECDVDVRNLETGSQIHRLMKRSRDSGEFIANLTNTQCTTLQKYTDRRREVVLQTLQARVSDRVREQGLQIGRNVVPVMKIRVADVNDDGEVSKAMMSIWRPNEAVIDIVKEGTWIDAFNIVPTARRYSEIQLSAGRQSVFSRSNYKVNEKVQQIVTNLKRTCYSIENLVKMPTAVTDYNEVDVVGLIFTIEPSIGQFEATRGQQFQNVYLTDTDKNIICVNFWGGLKKFGYENILDTGIVVACMNLQKRTGNSRKGIQQYRATEYSYFTKTSKHNNVRIMMDDLNKSLLSVNIKQLCESCVAIKNNISITKNVENVSPYRINYSDYNISKNRVFIDSPLASKPNHVDDIFNLSGLDFESTFKQIDTQDVPADVILRKKKVNEKIAKLKMYGEPPPLKAIHIINKSKNATKEFKSPLASRNDSSNSVASEKLHNKPNTNSAISCTESTPETSNKHMKRNANPVKLNFCSKPEDCGDKIDPFGEEFDVSPPLSLD
ncbi:PREDICTED: breast cancer type 2 susceptibility protein homolog isoform X2 [Papilio polytes]|uniref:breast cancer type 2 susceptibility protein homolog isoform X2 n=1 Tax=Papilio polytes TaxID=76194 RepID=UPI00067623C2|nr:PREDICTED: breast cancer type 2 susceptibility protein homolog isoform X2 [Papilio polytes]